MGTIANPEHQCRPVLLVYKEILGNIVKHTFSEQVDIQFVVNPDKSINLRVRNLFSERKINVPSGGQGLSIIQEHMARIGGVLKVTALEKSFEVLIHFNHPFKNWRNR